MLVYGTANPTGFGDHDYNGLYLTNSDIDSMIPKMAGVPVKIEHKGESVGRVLSAWRHNGRMDLLFELDGERNIEGALAKEFVKNGFCKDLSLGYKVSMCASASGKLHAGEKSVVEVSIVKQGARENCHIRGWGGEPGRHRIVI